MPTDQRFALLPTRPHKPSPASRRESSIQLNCHLPCDSGPPLKRRGVKDLRLTVVRQVGHNERKEETVTVAWDDSWRFDHSSPTGESSPEAIDELGLAYQIMSRVLQVDPDSPAASSGIQPGDMVKEVGLLDPNKDSKTQNDPAEWKDVDPSQWANTHWLLQLGGDLRKLFLKVQRGNESSGPI